MDTTLSRQAQQQQELLSAKKKLKKKVRNYRRMCVRIVEIMEVYQDKEEMVTRIYRELDNAEPDSEEN